MESNFNQNNGEGVVSKKRFFIFAGVLVSAVVLLASSLYWYQWYSDPDRLELKAFQDYQKQVEEAYKNDTYGGATPEETLRLFIEALKAEDIELASKYFALDDNLSRYKWVEFLENIKQRELLQVMANDIESKAVSVGASYEGNYAFEIYNNDGTVAVTIELTKNPYSNIWKVESL